nr:NACHT domain-containing protein [Morganella morganii]
MIKNYNTTIVVNKKTEKEIKITIDDKFSIENIKDGNIINIIGNAGQGKSTVLRKIALNQLTNGDKLPIFLSFNRIKTTIIDEIKSIFEANEYKCELIDIIALLRSDKIILIIDAFDEIDLPNKGNDLLNELDNINKIYQTTILTSTRPNTLICNKSHITNYHLIDLTVEDAYNLIIKVINNNSDINENYGEVINNTFIKHPTLKSTLKTPLLVLLFLKKFPTLSTIPTQGKDFYDDIFATLYDTHDLTKGHSIYRELQNKYSKDTTKTMFYLFCFSSFLANKSSFTLIEASEILNKGHEVFKKLLNTPKIFNYSDFLSLIGKCTSLIVRNGYHKNDDLYSFIHKTVQEYYSAFFFKEYIQNNPQEKEKLSNVFINAYNKNESDILQFFNFLCVLSPRYFIEKIQTPCLLELFSSFDFSMTDGKPSYSRDKFIFYIFNNCEITIDTDVKIISEKKQVSNNIINFKKIISGTQFNITEDQKYKIQHSNSFFLKMNLFYNCILNNQSCTNPDEYELLQQFDEIYDKLLEHISGSTFIDLFSLTADQEFKIYNKKRETHLSGTFIINNTESLRKIFIGLDGNIEREKEYKNLSDEMFYFIYNNIYIPTLDSLKKIQDAKTDDLYSLINI